jgi:hypothetical protein
MVPQQALGRDQGPRAGTVGAVDAKHQVAITHLRNQRIEAPWAGLRPLAARGQAQHSADSALRPNHGLEMVHQAALTGRDDAEAGGLRTIAQRGFSGWAAGGCTANGMANWKWQRRRRSRRLLAGPGGAL